MSMLSVSQDEESLGGTDTFSWSKVLFSWTISCLQSACSESREEEQCKREVSEVLPGPVRLFTRADASPLPRQHVWQFDERTEWRILHLPHHATLVPKPEVSHALIPSVLASWLPGRSTWPASEGLEDVHGCISP